MWTPGVIVAKVKYFQKHKRVQLMTYHHKLSGLPCSRICFVLGFSSVHRVHKTNGWSKNSTVIV